MCCSRFLWYLDPFMGKDEETVVLTTANMNEVFPSVSTNVSHSTTSVYPCWPAVCWDDGRPQSTLTLPAVRSPVGTDFMLMPPMVHVITFAVQSWQFWGFTLVCKWICISTLKFSIEWAPTNCAHPERTPQSGDIISLGGVYWGKWIPNGAPFHPSQLRSANCQEYDYKL